MRRENDSLGRVVAASHLPGEGLEEGEEVVLLAGRRDQDGGRLLVEGVREVDHCLADVRDSKSGQGEVHGLRGVR